MTSWYFFDILTLSLKIGEGEHLKLSANTLQGVVPLKTNPLFLVCLTRFYIMQATIEEYILRECKKLISRYQRKIVQSKRYQEKYSSRTGLLPGVPSTYEPKHWVSNKLFNPFYVRSRAKSIAHSIAKKIRTNSYKPFPALTLQIPKPNGTSRGITLFTIPDAAVSFYLFTTLRRRNQQLFSSYAYAYRNDRTAHHAIEALYNSIKLKSRTYILEYDFSKYFDSIDHEYIIYILKNKLKVSPREMKLINVFLKFQRANGYADYNAKRFQTNTLGFPQGSSISLFLANVACLELDHEIERTGASFARYADDTVILCSKYATAHECANLMQDHGKRSESKINFEKSDGISLLTLDPGGEIRCKTGFPFLGHSISANGITIAKKSIHRIKKKVATIIYKNLLLVPKNRQCSQTRITKSGLDWDMVTCINEIRRYIYGRIKEKDLTNCLNNKSLPLPMTKCLLSYYPLVDTPDVLQELDGWLLNVLQRAQLQRCKELKQRRILYAKQYSKTDLINGSWYKCRIKNETKLPSFFRAWLYVRRLLHVYDISKFPTPPYNS